MGVLIEFDTFSDVIEDQIYDALRNEATANFQDKFTQDGQCASDGVADVDFLLLGYGG